MDDSKQDWKRSFTRLSASESLFLWGNMGILDLDIKQTSPKIVMVDSAYLSYLHGFDSRVSLKKDRPYVGLAVRINDKVYVIPLTSQTTQERKKRLEKEKFTYNRLTAAANTDNYLHQLAFIKGTNLFKPFFSNYHTNIIDQIHKECNLYG